jgi:hypothetical protein
MAASDSEATPPILSLTPAKLRVGVKDVCQLARALRLLSSLQHDPNRPEDVLKVDADEDVGGDDTADCMRYLVATRERNVVQRKLRGL